MDPFIGQIIMFAGNFAPQGWALCDGQLLSIASNSALFSILGTTYGGDGVSTFALPDLRGRVPMHEGSGPGLTPRSLGQRGGTERVSLTTDQMPPHRHGVACAGVKGDTPNPLNAYPAGADNPYTQLAAANSMASDMVQNTGGGAPHDNVQPFQCVNFIIALVGIFPSQS